MEDEGIQAGHHLSRRIVHLVDPFVITLSSVAAFRSKSVPLAVCEGVMVTVSAWPTFGSVMLTCAHGPMVGCSVIAWLATVPVIVGRAGPVISNTVPRLFLPCFRLPSQVSRLHRRSALLRVGRRGWCRSRTARWGCWRAEAVFTISNTVPCVRATGLRRAKQVSSGIGDQAGFGVGAVGDVEVDQHGGGAGIAGGGLHDLEDRAPVVAPPAYVVPNKSPAASAMRPATGWAPWVESKLNSTVGVLA